MKTESSKNARGAQDSKGAKKSSKVQANDKSSSPPQTPTPAAASQQAGKDAASVDVDGEMSNTCPKIGSFYEFFSLSHLTPPLQCNALTLIPSLLLYSPSLTRSLRRSLRKYKHTIYQNMREESLN